MKQNNWKTYVIWIVVTEAVGALSGLLTREGTRLYAASVVKPPLSPPALVFPIAWAILYALMGAGAARVALSGTSAARSRGLLLYFVQLAFNFFWSIIFFNLEAFGFAFLWQIILFALVLMMTFTFAQVDRTAALLQIPYLLWLLFALYLNFGVWLLNR